MVNTTVGAILIMAGRISNLIQHLQASSLMCRSSIVVHYEPKIMICVYRTFIYSSFKSCQHI